ncbi:MAG: gamma-glutamyltransferase [Gemmatimonas sp.]|nr:gamma-glutamyltransferase [Gemmatimonas sp.]
MGASILRSGGNAVDAAVGVAFALTVTYPTAGNIGGGGLMLARMNGETFALDFRERAPFAAPRDMYLDAEGNPTDRSITGALAVGVPGSVAGLYAAHQKLGALPWRHVVQPAIELASNGFRTDSAFVEDIADNMARFSPASAALYAPQGAPMAVGTRFKNPDLARTLRLIADQGAKGFYEGETAEKLVAEMQRGGGIISLEDLKRYEPKWRTPVVFTYRGYQVLTMPPVSSGGLTFALIANILGGHDLRAMGAHSIDAIHVMAEAERVAFARRNTLLADPDFVPTPSASFLSPDTATALRARISMARHVTDRVAADSACGQHTTHFSVVDGKGNAVALTTTLNTGFGSAVTVTGAGFLLNNQMDDFTVKPASSTSRTSWTSACRSTRR